MLSLHGPCKELAVTVRLYFVKHNWLGGQVGHSESEARHVAQRGYALTLSLRSADPKIFSRASGPAFSAGP